MKALRDCSLKSRIQILFELNFSGKHIKKYIGVGL